MILRVMAFVAALTAASIACAEDAPPKEPSPWLAPALPADVPRLQQRLYTKRHQLYLDISGQYLSRADFYNNPAVGGTLAYYFLENWAVEIGFTKFFSSLQSPAQDVLKNYGVVPDAHQPYWLLRGGVRWTIGYGKILIGKYAIHLEPQLAGRIGVLSGDGVYDPGLDIALALLIHWSRWFHTGLEVSVFPHLEQRSSLTPVLGVIPSLSFGAGVEL